MINRGGSNGYLTSDYHDLSLLRGFSTLISDLIVTELLGEVGGPPVARLASILKVLIMRPKDLSQQVQAERDGSFGLRCGFASIN